MGGELNRVTYEVVLPAPFHWTAEAATKLVPLTVKVNAGPPAVTDDGETELIDGIAEEPEVSLSRLRRLLGRQASQNSRPQGMNI